MVHIKEKLSKMVKNKLVIKGLLLLILALVVATVVRIFFYNDKAEITSSYLGTQLSKVGELTTIKLKYDGIAEYKDKGIAFINRSDFIMRYKAVARVGIDLKQVKTEVDNKNKVVWLTIPKAEIQSVKVDPADIKYYDEKFSLFNVDEKEDGNKAIELAEKEARTALEQMGLLESADLQAFTLIKGILHNAVPSDYEFKLKESK
ncbi:MAG: DUF4230 domain-containing protein [Eubacteriales bacterium]|nr:DUF4230 domain-containing protein [Eubacteriales bacterium]